MDVVAKKKKFLEYNPLRLPSIAMAVLSLQAYIVYFLGFPKLIKMTFGIQCICL